MSYIMDKLNLPDLEESSTTETDSLSNSIKSFNTITPKSNSHISSEYSNISCTTNKTKLTDRFIFSATMHKDRDKQKMLYYRFNPFVSNDPKEGKEPDKYELRLIAPSQDNIHKYIAVMTLKNSHKDMIEVYFGYKDGHIYKDRTGLHLYHHKEKLSKEQAEQYYQNHKKKIEKKYSVHYFEWNFLMQTCDLKFINFVNEISFK